MTKTLFGVFADSENADRALQELIDGGYNPKDISIVMRGNGSSNLGKGAKVAQKTIAGAAEGVAIGGLAGLVIAAVVPGAGALLIGGPIAAALGIVGPAAATIAGATTGAIAGGVIGALVDLGLSAAEAEAYESQINAGAVLIAVPIALGDEEVVREIFNDYHASDVKMITHTAGMEVDSDEVEQDEEGYAPIYTRRPAYIGMKGGKSKRRVREQSSNN